MKKVFAIAALAFSMSLVSCGGDKGTGTDSDSTTKKDVPAVENTDNKGEVVNNETVSDVDADALIAKINDASSAEELMALESQFKQIKGNLPDEVVAKINAAGQAKAMQLMGGVKDAASQMVQSAEDLNLDELPDAANQMMGAAKEALDF